MNWFFVQASFTSSFNLIGVFLLNLFLLGFFYHPGQETFQILPFLILLNATTLQIFNTLHSIQGDFSSGVLSVLLARRGSFFKYLSEKCFIKILLETLPLTILSAFFISFTPFNPWAFSLSLFLLSLQTQSLAMIGSSIHASHALHPFLAIFLLLPFLIPGIILSLLIMDPAQNVLSFWELLGINFSLSLITMGMMFLIVPRLILMAFEG